MFWGTTLAIGVAWETGRKMGMPQNSSRECSQGCSPKSGCSVMEVSMKETTGALSGAPDFGEHLREHSWELFWGFPIFDQSPRPGSPLSPETGFCEFCSARKSGRGFSPHFGAISLPSYGENLEKREKRPLERTRKYLDTVFLFTVGSFLLTAELFCLQLCLGAFVGKCI